MALLFSSDGEDIISRKIEPAALPTHEACDISEFYEIPRCVEWINRNDFHRVALQFPDELLKDAAMVTLALEKQTQAKLYVLGDTSYGNCCVDEIAAEHVLADGIIHFGHACLSPTSRLPVLYIFGKFPLDAQDVSQKFQTLFPNKETSVLVFCDVFYIHAIENLKAILEVDYSNLVFSQHRLLEENRVSSVNANESQPGTCISRCGRTLYIPDLSALSSYHVFYIGSEQRTLMNLMLSFSDCQFFSYNPSTLLARQETLDVNKYLRKRYYCIERVKDAKIIGILVGTLGVSNYLSVIDHLRTLAKCSGKKTYTLVVGKLNPAKLANFSEIDVFVYVSCPESSIIDSHEFYQPIVTPFEMEVACNQARTWNGSYVTDFNELLPGASSYIPLNPKQDEISDVSLVTGKFRLLGNKSKDDEEDSSSDILLRDSMTVANVHANAAGEHLVGRSWRGLEPRLGETQVSTIVQGKLGIAAGYEGEGSNSTT